MAIILNCPHCEKRLEAAENLGGRRIKCPRCKRSLRVPAATDGPEGADRTEVEALTVAPLDQEDERERKRLITDSLMLSQFISEQTAEVPEDGDTPPEPDEGHFHVSHVTMSEQELHDAIVEYLRCMADGHLEQALPLCESIVAHGTSAIAIVDAIALREIPEEALSDIPPQVLSGLIRTLRAQFP